MLPYTGRVLLLLFLISFQYILGAQNQNNQWRFGNNGAIDFNTIPPSSPAGCAIQTPEGSASVADRQTGALLFYTDGITIWNAANQPMPNGNGLFGGTSALLSSTTAAVIVPKPFSPGIYYVVTIDEQSSNRGLRYSVVDMALNGGLGDVAAGQKNLFLFSTTSEKLQVVPTADGCGYWLLTHNNPGATFFAFKITQNGIQTTPIQSTGGGTQSNGAGHMKVNRQFTKLAMGNLFDSTIELFDFNNATGVVSNPLIWTYAYPNALIYGVEFSPDGSKLYISNIQRVVQYDLSQPTVSLIEASGLNISQGFDPYEPASLQLGPDHRIYIAAGSIDVINFPDKAGAACDFQPNGIDLQNGLSQYGLPQWIYDNQPVGTNEIVVENTCLSDSTVFSLQNTEGLNSINWHFGDPASPNNTSLALRPTHVFSQTGQFTVQAIITFPCSTDTISQTIDIRSCTSGITGIKILGDTCSSEAISLQVTGTSSSPYFFWNFDDPASGTQDTVTITGLSQQAFPTHTFSGPGVYNVCVTFTEPGLAAATICRSISVGLCCAAQIVAGDSCVENAVPFSIITGASVSNVTWNFGDPASGANNTSGLALPVHVFSEAGSYSVQAFISSDCGLDTATLDVNVVNCTCNLYIPNAFTPNGDGINDQFQPISNCALAQYKFSVFDRWGELVFSSSDPAAGWDGKSGNRDCASDVFAYLFTYQLGANPAKTVYGDVTLLR